MHFLCLEGEDVSVRFENNELKRGLGLLMLMTLGMISGAILPLCRHHLAEVTDQSQPKIVETGCISWLSRHL